jgi:hydrogenase/urease accessory protein HupE
MRRLAAVALLIAMSPAARAHQLSPGFFGMTETAPDRYDARWKVSVSGGLADALTPELPEGCVVAVAPRSFLLDGVTAVNEFRLQQASVLCDGPLAGETFRIAGLENTDTDVLLSIVYADGTSFSHRLLPSRPSVVIPARPGVLDVIATYTLLGIEHILIGFDHLLFVLALLLLVADWRRLVWTITAFTLAHSVTLGAATLGWVSVSGAAVEATIALSILFLATELARRGATAGASVRLATAAPGLSLQSGLPSQSGVAPEALPGLTVRYPWIVAFAFGLLHGFGFAGALADIGLPQNAIPLALLFFNVGVEIGQLLFIAAALAFIWVLKRLRAEWPVWSPRAVAYVIGSLAAFWVLQRTVTAVWPLT